MRPTHEYSATQYTRDNGFPLTWIIRLFTKRATSRIDDEAEENHHRQRSQRKGKIIGKAAGAEAYTGRSAALRGKERGSGRGEVGQLEEVKSGEGEGEGEGGDGRGKERA